MILVDSVVSTSGGAERFALGLAVELSSAGRPVTFVATRNVEAWAAQRLRDAGVELLVLGRTRSWQVHRFVKLWRLLRAPEVGILHTHKFGSNVWGMLFGTLAGVRTRIAQEHTWSFEGQAFRRLLDRWVVGQLSSRFIAVSRHDADAMHSVEGIPAEKIVVLPTGFYPAVRDASWPQPGQAVDQRGSAPPTIGIAAMLRPQKALDVLIRAVRTIRESVPDVQVLIAGDGPCREALEALAASEGVASNVRFLGSTPTSAPVLAQADVAVLSSLFEGMPLFALEAMESAIPLVATRVGGLPDLIVDQVSGILVEPGDSDDLAQSLVRLLVEPQLAAEIGLRGRERATQFHMATVAQKYNNLYSKEEARIKS